MKFSSNHLLQAPSSAPKEVPIAGGPERFTTADAKGRLPMHIGALSKRGWAPEDGETIEKRGISYDFMARIWGFLWGFLTFLGRKWGFHGQKKIGGFL